ncbi:MerR family transcriptional regulator [Homoserinibacter gongjuensis]|jgi:DNA-binding transcriptional MerR regulator|uniref:Transcriptional regulator, MerR family protein n=1 Tax=Homoserinibacter gongjuensis TaxID=1162968 RepID=A0ABQ6JW37_9MICO|nr:MerR family transcriptional regulator [Homoserinibacter gongjuensis]GMA92453.1 transcriptional regulator, MerR family protein [Homoserinibacter gongjuensis]
MSWSTRALAALAGTTVNTIRHYHRLGLLDQPQRRTNGYKEYEVRHLVRLLRIRRLVELGMPLATVSKVSAGADGTTEALRNLDADLTARIAQLTRARADIAELLHDNAPADAPAGFASVAAHLSEPDSALIHLSARLYDASALRDLRRMVEADAEADALGTELAELPPDADENARRRLAERLSPTLARNLIEYPWLVDPAAHLAGGVGMTRRTFVEAMVEFYTPAQLDVLARAAVLAQDIAHTTPRPGGPPSETTETSST